MGSGKRPNVRKTRRPSHLGTTSMVSTNHVGCIRHTVYDQSKACAMMKSSACHVCGTAQAMDRAASASRTTHRVVAAAEHAFAPEGHARRIRKGAADNRLQRCARQALAVPRPCGVVDGPDCRGAASARPSRNVGGRRPTAGTRMEAGRTAAECAPLHADGGWAPQSIMCAAAPVAAGALSFVTSRACAVAARPANRAASHHRRPAGQ